MFAKKVEQKSNGRLVIDYLGGPEVIGGFDQPGAISTGVVDLGGIPGTYIASMAKATNAVQLLIGTPQELRQRGWFEVLNGLLATVNLYELGALDFPNDRYLWSRVPIRKVADVKGLKLRAIGTDANFARALGASPLTIPLGDIYTAQERGLVNGHFIGVLTEVTLKLYEVSKYVVNHTIYSGGDLALVINLDRLNRLPADLQKIVKDSMIETEVESIPMKQAIADEGLKTIRAAGVEFVTFSPEDKAKYLELFYESNWKEIVKDDPVWGPKLREKAGDWREIAK